MEKLKNLKEKTLRGIAASAGVIIAKSYVLNEKAFNVFNIKKKSISESEVPVEIERFNNAITATRNQLLNLQQKISREMDEKHAHIFQAHLLILEDPMLIKETIQKVTEEKMNVEYELNLVLEKISNVFEKMNDGYLKERLSDIKDVGNRLLRNLLGEKHASWENMEKDVIIVAYDLSPSDTAIMHKEKVAGFVTDVGGKTSHTAIMARSLEIPAVVGLEIITQEVSSGDILIIDGNEGIVIINPKAATIKKYKQLQEKIEKAEKELSKLKNLPAVTLDNYRIHLHANIEFPGEIDSVLEHGAEGIGLYRTEFLFMNREQFPSEEERLEAFRGVVAKMAPRPVTIRTLDLGGDKFISYLNISGEMNPYLGLRAIRLCLQNIEMFKTQLKAILRASILKNLRIMFPMISGLDELIKVKAILNEVKNDLRKKRIPFDENIKVGAMIEIPSAAMIADILAREVDFFSIGTNDLIQYTLAVERANEKVAYLYDPLHPAVLRLIKLVIDAAGKYNIDVSMCGEMASDPSAVMILTGMGLKELSMSPVIIPEIKKIIRATSFKEAGTLTEKALHLVSSEKVEKLVNNAVKELGNMGI
ncbi:phosphoenolpyruvate--protein phosphotransferase [Candidatus Desantisbacteria bacterium]|nr:phosphoenolpyruvate--protein phosphotransferase [Candidatus Desantisbacteria bacterium]